MKAKMDGWLKRSKLVKLTAKNFFKAMIQVVTEVDGFVLASSAR